jgi:hypothetical protein
VVAVAEGVVMGAAATAERHRGWFVQDKLKRHPAGAQVSAIAEPAVAASPAAAELMHAGWKLQRFRAWGGWRGLRHRPLRQGLSKFIATRLIATRMGGPLPLLWDFASYGEERDPRRP